MVVIGIDPGKQTGMAWYRDGRLVMMGTFTPDTVAGILGNQDVIPDLVVVEDSRLQTYFGRSGQNARGQAKIARDVGRIDGQCADIQACCERLGLRLIRLSPKAKGAKLNHAQFAAKTGWPHKSNPHTRDAACVAWPFRNGYEVGIRTYSNHTKQGIICLQA